MKKIISALVVALAVPCAFAAVKKAPETVTPASDSRITYVGRTLVAGDNVSFDWSGIYAKVKFEGRYIALNASDTKKNYYNVWLDKTMDQTPDKVINISGDTTVVLFSETEILASCEGKAKVADGIHEVIIQKRSEGEQGKATFASFVTKGNVHSASPVADRLIEFVGDSYTCGYGTENSTKNDPFRVEDENCNLTYAALISRYFGADYMLVSHSGMGIARNYNDNVKGYYMPDRYSQTFDMDKSVAWNASESSLKPNLTVVYLCTNDFSCSRQPSKSEFMSQYHKLLNKIADNYGKDHPVLCIAGKGDIEMTDYVRSVALSSGLSNVHYMLLAPDVHNNESDLGASWHPNAVGQRKKAFAIIPYVATVMNWDMEDKPIR